MTDEEKQLFTSVKNVCIGDKYFGRISGAEVAEIVCAVNAAIIAELTGDVIRYDKFPENEDAKVDVLYLTFEKTNPKDTLTK